MATPTAEELRAQRWRTAQTLRASAERARSARLRGREADYLRLLERTEALKRHDRNGVPTIWEEGTDDG